MLVSCLEVPAAGLGALVVVSLGDALSDSEEDELASLNEVDEPAEKRSSWDASSCTWLLSCGLNSWFCTRGVRAGGGACVCADSTRQFLGPRSVLLEALGFLQRAVDEDVDDGDA